MSMKELTDEQRKMQTCQQTKDCVNCITEHFLSYVTLCLAHEEYIEAINALLPTGKFTQIRQRNAYDHSLVENMGIVVERIGSNSPTFSLGVSIELAAGRYSQALSVTVPVSTCRTFEELRDLVQTDDFARKVRQDFEKQVEIIFSQKSL